MKKLIDRLVAGERLGEATTIRWVRANADEMGLYPPEDVRGGQRRVDKAVAELNAAASEVVAELADLDPDDMKTYGRTAADVANAAVDVISDVMDEYKDTGAADTAVGDFFRGAFARIAKQMGRR